MRRYPSFGLVLVAIVALPLITGCPDPTVLDPCSGISCDDGDTCTVDSCDNGTCVNAPMDCPQGETCESGQCGRIVPAECRANDRDDGVFCNGSDTCIGGSWIHTGNPCEAGQTCNEGGDRCDDCTSVADCADNNPCTNDSCVNGTCLNTNNNTSCNDGAFCNGSDTCSGGVCTHAGNPCTSDQSCNEGTNKCDDCDTDVDCLDNNPCTSDVCLDGKCSHINNNVPCDDGVYCNGSDTCSGGTCIHAGNPCAAGQTCNEGADSCPDCTTDADCDDGDFCNGSETCDNTGTCKNGTSPCSANQVCDEEDNRCTKAGKMYWTQRASDIMRADLNGDNVETVVITDGPTQLGISLDLVARKVYWVRWDGSNSSNARIQRADLDGPDFNTNFEPNFITGLNTPYGIAVSNAANKVYWASSGGNRIGQATLSGANVETLVPNLSDGPFGIDFNPAGGSSGQIYWTENSFPDTVKRVDFSGSNVQTLVSGLSEPNFMALDLAGSKMYWTDSDSDEIRRADLDGSNVENVLFTGDTPMGIAIDSGAGKIYWTEWEPDKIRRANLDGTDVEDLITSGLDVPVDIALDVPGGG